MERNIYIDIDLCVGCGACAVACMDQNDIDTDLKQPPFRRVYQIEEGNNPSASIYYISAGCIHCENNPCAVGCPTGAITRNETTRAVIVRKELCIGCHSCALACPFGVPRYDSEGKMSKCELCSERVEFGYEPACVRACPYSALRFESINTIQEEKEINFINRIVKTGR